MKLLLDENLSRRLVARLTADFPETTHVEDIGLLGQPDTSIWDYAASKGFIVVSKDDDFRQLSFFRGAPPKVIWLIIGNAGTDEVAELLLHSHAAITEFVYQTENALLTLRTDIPDGA